jgi:hypothetical protein
MKVNLSLIHKPLLHAWIREAMVRSKTLVKLKLCSKHINMFSGLLILTDTYVCLIGVGP